MAVGLDVDERNRIIGDNLRKYRLLKGLTQDELADGLCSVSQLSKVENGKTYVKRTVLKQMADRLGVPVERIESADALLEELTENLQLARDHITARNYDDARELLEQVITCCHDFGYRKLQVDALHSKFEILLERKDYETIIRLANEALEEKWYVDNIQKIMLFLDIGRAYEMYGDQQAAIDCYLLADEEYECLESDGDHSQFRFQILFGLAKYHGTMGNHRACIRYANRAEREATSANMHLRRIRCRYMKAIPYRKLGELEKAEQIYLEVLQEAQDNSFLLDTGIIQNNLGEIYMDRGELGLAQQCFKRASQLFELVHADIYLYLPKIHLAEMEIQDKSYDEGLRIVDELLELCERIGVNSYRERAGAIRLKAKAMFEVGDTESFFHHIQEALAIYQRHHVWDEAYELSVEIADFLYARGDSQSVEYYKQAVEYNKTLKTRRR